MMSLQTKVARDFVGRNLAGLTTYRSSAVGSKNRSLHTSETTAFAMSPATVQIKPGGAWSHRSEVEEKEAFLNHIQTNESFRNSMAYSLSFADANSAEDYNAFAKLPDARMQEQLARSSRMVYPPVFDNSPLPRTLQDALRPSLRAIVITEMSRPFKIVDVNKAWEGLCGYSFVECQGKTLGSLLRGPKTDPSAVTALMSQLLRGEEAGTVLTNYKKDGSSFRNHLRVGPLMQDGKVSHFVGVLQEIQ